MKIYPQYIKRLFDIIISLIGLLLLGWIICIAYLAVAITNKGNGFYQQIRIGRDGEKYKIIKICTMREVSNYKTNITTSNDPRITPVGRIIRRWKIDELPQLINVLLGQMSIVGPRPDVPGYADKLSGDDRIILSIRPGITGPASIKYKKEEEILAQQANPEQYNREVIWIDKVRINKEYVQSSSFLNDLKYIIATFKN